MFIIFLLDMMKRPRKGNPQLSHSRPWTPGTCSRISISTTSSGFLSPSLLRLSCVHRCCPSLSGVDPMVGTRPLTWIRSACGLPSVSRSAEFLGSVRFGNHLENSGFMVAKHATTTVALVSTQDQKAIATLSKTKSTAPVVM